MLKITGSDICGYDGFVHVAADSDLVLNGRWRPSKATLRSLRRSGKSTPGRVKFLGPMSTGEVFEPDVGPVGTPERL